MKLTTIHAAPKFSIGEEVIYTDHHNRVQGGRVFQITAKWWAVERTGKAFITYAVEHPTYKDGRMYISEDGLRAAHPTQEPTNG